MSFHILEEEPNRPNCRDSSSYIRPKVSGVLFSFPLTGIAKRLAGITPNDSVYSAVKLFCREGFKIRPNRSWIHLTRFDLRNQVCTCEHFDLHIAFCGNCSSRKSDSEFKSTISRAKTDNALCFGIIHIVDPLSYLSLYVSFISFSSIMTDFPYEDPLFPPSKSFFLNLPLFYSFLFLPPQLQKID